MTTQAPRHLVWMHHCVFNEGMGCVTCRRNPNFEPRPTPGINPDPKGASLREKTMNETLTSVRQQVESGTLPESALLARLIKEENYRTRYLAKIRKEIADLHEKEKGELLGHAARLP